MVVVKAVMVSPGGSTSILYRTLQNWPGRCSMGYRGPMPPGRPRSFDTDQALDAAMDLFWRRGYRGTSTRDLQDALGLSPSSLRAAFGGKEQLAAAALERYLELLDEGLIAPLRDGPGGLSAIDRFLAGLSEWHRADGGRGCMVGRLMCDGVDDLPAAPAGVVGYRRDLRHAVGAALTRAEAAGEVSPADHDRRCDLVSAVVLGMNLSVRAGDAPERQRALADAGRAQVASWALTAHAM